MYMMDGTETNTQALAALDENTRSVLSNAQIKKFDISAVSSKLSSTIFYFFLNYKIWFELNWKIRTTSCLSH